ncbi:hypothetical protein A2U01_0083691, partial [Trifolium medium]|nr:hypothetical protein [Trifolium medium]
EFLGGLELKPPQSTLFCVLSLGDVRRRSSPVLVGIRQSLANFLFLSRCLSPGEAKREGLGQNLFG